MSVFPQVALIPELRDFACHPFASDRSTLLFHEFGTAEFAGDCDVENALVVVAQTQNSFRYDKTVSAIVAYAVEMGIPDRLGSVLVLPEDVPNEVLENLVSGGGILAADMRFDEEAPDIPAIFSHDEFVIRRAEGKYRLSEIALDREPTRNQLRMIALEELGRAVNSLIQSVSISIRDSGCRELAGVSATRFMAEERKAPFVESALFGRLDEQEKTLLAFMTSSEGIRDANLGMRMRGIPLTGDAELSDRLSGTAEGKLARRLVVAETCWEFAVPVADISDIPFPDSPMQLAMESAFAAIRETGREYGVDIMFDSVEREGVLLEHACPPAELQKIRERRYALDNEYIAEAQRRRTARLAGQNAL